MSSRVWVGIGLFAVAALFFVMAATQAKDLERRRQTAVEQACYAQGTCTITDSDKFDWTHHTKDDTDRGSSIEVTMTVHAPTGDVKGVEYRYADTDWNTISAKQAIETTHKPGSTIQCFYDAKNPEHAVLLRRGPPPDETSPWVFGSMFGVPCVLVGLLLLFIKPDGKKRHDD